MGTYNLPRNVKGEGRILFVFTGKSFIYAIVAGGVGLLFYFIFSMVGLKIVGIAITAIFALIGFAIGTFKMPEISHRPNGPREGCRPRGAAFFP